MAATRSSQVVLRCHSPTIGAVGTDAVTLRVVLVAEVV
jgi:hypothetical protein